MFSLVSVVQAATLNKIAAVVNGSMISFFDLQQTALPELKKLGIDPNAPANKDKVQQVYNEVLNTLILEILLVHEAEKNGITVAAEDVEAELAKMMEKSNLSKQAFEKQLKKEGLTPGILRSRIEKNILRQRLMSMMVGRKIVVTPEEIQEYYTKHQASMVSQGGIELAILVYPDSVDPRPHAAQLAKDPSKFEALVKQLSEGPHKENGGHMGLVNVAAMPEGLAKFIKAIDTGKVSKIVVLNGKKTQFKMVKKSSGGQPLTFEEAKPMIEDIVRQPKLKARFEEYVEQLRKRAVVDIRM